MQINGIIKTKIDTAQITETFGDMLDCDGRTNRITEQRFLKFALGNNIDPMIYYSVLNQRINEVHYNQLSEHINPTVESSLKNIFDRFDDYATNNITFGIGDAASLLELEAYDYGPRNRHIVLRGFKTPKEITGRNSQYVQFEDGSVYPSIQVFQTRNWRQIAMFSQPDHLDRCLTIMSLLLSDGVQSRDGEWQNDKFEIEE